MTAGAGTGHARGTTPAFEVRNGRNRCHLIPYVGNKAGFAHVFDALVPDSAGDGRILDLFGGGASFTIYCSYRFGSRRVTYNDSNPVLANFVTWVRDDPAGLEREYEMHRERSDTQYYLGVRGMPLDDGLAGAGRFLYLAKNAFSGKIRFNASNGFNSPMRKGNRCPSLDVGHLERVSKAIRDVTITNVSYERYGDVRGSFVYLDPPYMGNPNGHYNGVPDAGGFAAFVGRVGRHNDVMVSEQTHPRELGLPADFVAYPVLLKRSLQYNTRRDSREVIMVNYGPTPAAYGRMGGRGAHGGPVAAACTHGIGGMPTR